MTGCVTLGSLPGQQTWPAAQCESCFMVTVSVGKMSTRTFPNLSTKMSKLYHLIAKQETENLNFIPTLQFCATFHLFYF